MLRDMEELLNSVVYDDIKEYLKEALNCYNAGSYRACVIMSVIAGMYDLHKKVKALANSNPTIRRLDYDIEDAIKHLRPYEKFLVEKCASEKIDMLNSNEEKAIKRCLDIRNDCAHPSNFICSAEIAREVYSTIIDFLSSKPVLLGQQSIQQIIEKLKGNSYFSIIENEEISNTVKTELKYLHIRALRPLAQKLTKIILDESFDTNTHRINIIAFLAYMSNIPNINYNESIGSIICKDDCNDNYLQMLNFNPCIVDNLEDVNIKRTLSKLSKIIQNESNYENMISEVISHCYIYKKDFQELIGNLLCENPINISVVKHNILKGIFNNQQVCDHDKDYLKGLFTSNYLQMNQVYSFPLKSYFYDILSLCNINESKCKFYFDISKDLRDSDYTIANHAIKAFEKIPNELFDMLDKKDISYIVYSILKGRANNTFDIMSYTDDLSTKYIFTKYFDLILDTFNIVDLKLFLSFKLDMKGMSPLISTMLTLRPTFVDTIYNLIYDYYNQCGKDEDSEVFILYILSLTILSVLKKDIINTIQINKFEDLKILLNDLDSQ
ncbi:hypothetical protein SAMN05421659_109145 [[Clostridium] fimetarium]|uniref:Uncharacterized protein n=2 Tax=[Clostridium] fimetarium TaxID=99656 RepID=A0A1I0QUT2_9FIRM|nr:hypothetical protein SAMN05421659_109145 [[Clostridium] fimetarium]